MINLGIGIPLSWPFCHSDFFDSFTLMDKHQGHVIRSSSGPIHEMRNAIVSRALELECSHVIFLDTDMVFPDDTITRLLEADKDIIGALTFKRYPPFHPILFGGDKGKLHLIDPYPEDIIEVTATGTGCLLVKIGVFDAIDYPWFTFDKTIKNKTIGEDINFCYKARKLGFKVFVDTRIKTEHMCQMRVNENLWKLNKELRKTKQGGFTF